MGKDCLPTCTRALENHPLYLYANDMCVLIIMEGIIKQKIPSPKRLNVKDRSNSYPL